ncbi:MAG: hypothetical protein HMLIMOIP_001696 [Candidatus Nitrosomirales archaeon]|jgi:hypothetical protein
MQDVFETYLREMAHIRSSGAAVDETSYYPVISKLLNEIGKQLKPQLTCIMHIKNKGAGLPDGGLFTQDQFQSKAEIHQIPGQLPARGVIEVKGAGDDTWITAKGDQVSKYWRKYNQVLVTNYRDFLLIGRDSDGRPLTLESFRLAESESSFWAAAANPRKTAQMLGDRFMSYLRRVMLHSAALTDPKDVAWFLASYAREAKTRIEGKDLPALAALRSGLEESLGIRFEGLKGDHFFRSTLVQTLFYGIFSAWVLWSKQHPSNSKAHFDWRSAAWSLRIPMVRELFEQIATPTKLGALEIDVILNWTELALERVDRSVFFNKFEERHAVQYFYEPFLEAFDPELRKELGVWYTPPEIVKYMVSRVDTLLRQELEIPDGLADERVYILDPGSGTGSYLVEVLHKIAQTLKEKGDDALIASELKKTAMQRVFGFEILPAPFVVAHLQIGLLLHSFGAELSSTRNERIGVYLTNALTGWEFPDEPQKRLSFPELEEERDAADQIKREKPILVILGNPPYNSFAGVSPKEEQGLVEPYKKGLISEWGIRKFNLDDLYVRFFRLAERRIVEQTGRGIVCYITNFSFLSEASFVVMRRRFLEEFDEMWFDCMNGSSRETGKRTPDDKPDPSVFSTERNPEGIRVGTVISTLVRKSAHGEKSTVRYRNFWGEKKREDLVKSLELKRFDQTYDIVSPNEQNLYSLRSAHIPSHYLTWPTLIDLCRVHPFHGPFEVRGNSLIKLKADKKKLEVVRDYLDAQKSDDQIRVLAPRFMVSSGEFKAEEARTLILKRGVRYDPKKIVKYQVKSLDVRVAYLDSAIQPLFARPSPDLLNLREISGNAFLVTRDTADRRPEGSPFYYSTIICDYDCMSGHARHLPFLIHPMNIGKNKLLHRKTHPDTQATLTGERASHSPIANLSEGARKYLKNLGISDPDTDVHIAELLFLHSLAIGYSPSYITENADGIRVSWPRVPLPSSKKLLLDSAALGKKIAELLDTEKDVQGVTVSPVRPELKSIAIISRKGGGSLNLDAGDLKVTAGWGHGTEIVMPGKGKAVERKYIKEERASISQGCTRLGLKVGDIYTKFGENTLDIFLNEIAYWRNVPTGVWNYIIGGHQILKKWLSYREYEGIGRSMIPEEAREFTNIVRRIAAILLLERALDENYRKIKGSTYKWNPKEANR